MSIFFRLSGQSKQRLPDFLLPRHFLQLLRRGNCRNIFVSFADLNVAMKLLVLFLLFCVAVAHELSDCAPGPGPGPDRPKNPKDKDGGVPDKVDKGHLREALKIKWKTKKGRSFLFVPFPYPWAVAQLFCQKLGGILATVHHQKVDTFLVNLSGGKPAWIGFSDAQQNGVWLWIGGEPDQHANWCRGQPDNLQGEQNCALISWGPKTCWDDQSCLTLLPFICEKRR